LAAWGGDGCASSSFIFFHSSSLLSRSRVVQCDEATQSITVIADIHNSPPKDGTVMFGKIELPLT
jgi:hypothetical protein